MYKAEWIFKNERIFFFTSPSHIRISNQIGIDFIFLSYLWSLFENSKNIIFSLFRTLSKSMEGSTAVVFITLRPKAVCRDTRKCSIYLDVSEKIIILLDYPWCIKYFSTRSFRDAIRYFWTIINVNEISIRGVNVSLDADRFDPVLVRMRLSGCTMHPVIVTLFLRDCFGILNTDKSFSDSHIAQ